MRKRSRVKWSWKLRVIIFRPSDKSALLALLQSDLGAWKLEILQRILFVLLPNHVFAYFGKDKWQFPLNKQEQQRWIFIYVSLCTLFDMSMNKRLLFNIKTKTASIYSEWRVELFGVIMKSECFADSSWHNSLWFFDIINNKIFF